MSAPDRETPSTSWAVWAWQAYRDGRLVEANETCAPLAEALAVPEVAALVKAAYEQGANDVHANWQADKAPDFSEAASDYAAAALRAIGGDA